MRKSNWPGSLALFVEEKRAQPFDWETNNCAFFACDWITILTGVDPTAQYRPRVNSALSAARVLAEAGGIEAIAARACEENGWPEIPPRLAQRGDILLSETTDEKSLGVCAGRDGIFAGKAGLVSVPVLKCVRAWRIS